MNDQMRLVCTFCPVTKKLKKAIAEAEADAEPLFKEV